MLILNIFSLYHSPRGWTDTELALIWLMKEFEIQTRDRANGGYRLLLLDGHVSHLSYQFCAFAERHQIIVLCLPPHTTHALQPCDVGAFGPLESAWRSEVTAMSRASQPIFKNNLLAAYARARLRAMTNPVVRSAWLKTGIWPTDITRIPTAAYEPAKITTTAAAQPLPTIVSDLLEPATPPPGSPSPSPSASTLMLDHSTSTAISSATGLTALSSVTAASSASQFRPGFVGQPAPMGGWPSRDRLQSHCDALQALLDRAREQVEADHAQKLLMDRENARLRSLLFQKSGRRGRTEVAGAARHMTADENLDLLAKRYAEQVMKTIITEMAPHLWRIRDHDKEMVEEEEARRKEEVAKEKAKQKEEKEKERAEEADRKKKKKEVEAAEREVRKQTKKHATAERKRLTAERRARKEAEIAERRRARGVKQATKAKKGRRKVKVVDTPEEFEEEGTEDFGEEVVKVLSDVESMEDAEEEAKGEPEGNARHTGGQQRTACVEAGPGVPLPQPRSQPLRLLAKPPISDVAAGVEAGTIQSAGTMAEGAIMIPKPRARPRPIVKVPPAVAGSGRVTRSSSKRS
jgi:hypothetical protein